MRIFIGAVIVITKAAEKSDFIMPAKSNALTLIYFHKKEHLWLTIDLESFTLRTSYSKIEIFTVGFVVSSSAYETTTATSIRLFPVQTIAPIDKDLARACVPKCFTD